MKTIKVAELFAGVGGFRLGLEGYHDPEHPEFDMPKAGPFKTVWANQWEPPGNDSKQFAWRCYEARFGEGSCVNEDINKVLDAYEYWYGEPYADPAGADTERETAADPSMLPRFSLPGLSDRFGGSLDAGPQNTGLTTAAYNMAGRGIIELWDKGDDANRQKARDQLAAVWPSLSEEQKRNMRSVLGLHGMEISA